MPKPTGLREVLARALADLAPAVHVLDETSSTNDDAKRLAREGASDLTVVVADAQTAGRGRRERTWSAEAGTSLLASWVSRPALPVERWSLLPLIVGVACAEAVRARAGVDVWLKWPNDILAGERKLGGILVEAEPPAFAVVGVGINVSQTRFEDALAGTATSLALEGATRLDRADLLAEILRAFREHLAEPNEALDRFRRLCATLGRRVRVERDGAEPLQGVARDVDPTGALLVDGTAVAAGDVVHLR